MDRVIQQEWYNTIGTYIDNWKVNTIFFRVKEPYGCLSNMSNEYPLVVNGHNIANNEALYQACRFPDHPEIQQEIIIQRSGIAAKMKSKKYRTEHTRADWDDVRVDIMRYCIQLKLQQNEKLLGAVLKLTGCTQIVERSSKDNFWGAIWDENADAFVGYNVLGKLIMEVRQQFLDQEIELNDNGAFACQYITPITFGNFKLLGENII